MGQCLLLAYFPSLMSRKASPRQSSLRPQQQWAKSLSSPFRSAQTDSYFGHPGESTSHLEEDQFGSQSRLHQGELHSGEAPIPLYSQLPSGQAESSSSSGKSCKEVRTPAAALLPSGSSAREEVQEEASRGTERRSHRGEHQELPCALLC